MRAFITGISGQDGSYLSEYLLSLGYEVHGIIRRQSTPEHQESRIAKLDVITHYGDLSDTESLGRLLREIQPDEIYNLAAQSHVRISFDIPQYTAQINALGVLNLLEAARQNSPEAKIYQASSSEMFGNSIDVDGFQRITTPMRPVSPYGAAKLFGYNITRVYRESYGMKISNGILFNHESPRRASNFVTQKIIKAAVLISQGKQDVLELGNLDAKRDWGHSKDYVRAMHLILQHEPKDYTVATGVTNSVRNLCEIVFCRFNLNYRDYVFQSQKYYRPNELNELRGHSAEIRALGWKPEYTFEKLINEMIDDYLHTIHE